MLPLMVMAASFLATASGDLSSLMALDTALVLDGELWRVVTGHLAHLSWRQYAVDAPAFALLYAAYARRTTASRALQLALFAALAVSWTVMLAGVHEVYGGLSGLCCAAVSAILSGMILERPRTPLPYLAGLLFLCYLLLMGGFASGVRVAHEAHVAGALAGVIVALTRREANGAAAGERGRPAAAGEPLQDPG